MPSLLQLLLDRFPDLQQRLPRLTFWVTSGEALSREVYRHFQARMPNSVLYNLYGISKAGISLGIDRTRNMSVTDSGAHRPSHRERAGLRPRSASATRADRCRRRALCRRSRFGPRISHLSPANRRAVPPRSIQPGSQARLYKTGDVARYLPDGNLEFRGRVDDQIKLRGYRIEPREIERALEQHPAIRHAIVIAREGTPGDLRLIAYVVTHPDQRPTTRALRRFLHTLVPAHMVPSAFVTLDRFPLTPSGKVDRRALRTPDDRRPALQDGFVAPRNATEAALATIWAQLLRVARVGVHDNFFELGGRSLLAMQLLSRTHTATGIEVPLRRFFAAPTVADAAVFLDTAHPTLPEVIPAAPRRQSLPASVAQEHLWHLDRMHPGSSAFNISYAVRLRGALDRRVLDESGDALLRRHEALRTTFKLVDGRLVRVITSVSGLAITIIDLQAISMSEREDETQRLATAAAGRPFDLARGPLLRLTLWQQNPHEHLLLLTMHHIIADAWSIGILVRTWRRCTTLARRARRSRCRPYPFTTPTSPTGSATGDRRHAPGRPCLLEGPATRPSPSSEAPSDDRECQTAWLEPHVCPSPSLVHCLTPSRRSAIPRATLLFMTVPGRLQDAPVCLCRVEDGTSSYPSGQSSAA